MSGLGPWPFILAIIAINGFTALISGQQVDVLDGAAVILLLAGLTGFIVLIGASGSDPFSAAEAGIIAARVIALTAFIAGVALYSLTNTPPGYELIFGFVNLLLGGTAIVAAAYSLK